MGLTPYGEFVRALKKALRSSGWGLVDDVIDEFGFVPDAQDLAKALKDKNSEVRRIMLDLYSSYDVYLEPDAVITITKALSDKDEHIRQNAASKLGLFGPDAKDAWPALISALKDKNKEVRLRAAEALELIGPVANPNVPVLVKALDEEDWEIRKHIAIVLGDIGHDAEDAIPALNRILESKDQSVSIWVHYALAKITLDSKSHIEYLVKTCKSNEKYIRDNAADALGRIGVGAVTSVPVLVDIVQDANYSVNTIAERSLSSIGPYMMKGTTSDHIKALKECDKFLHERADKTQDYFGLGALPALIETLSDKNKNIRINSAWALGKVASTINENGQLLSELFDKKYSTITDYKSKYLDPIPSLSAALGDRVNKVRINVARTLGEFGTSAEAAVPALVKLLKDRNSEVRRSAADALGKIDTSADISIPPLIEVLRTDKNPEVRRYAAYALVDIGPISPYVIPALIKALKDKEIWFDVDSALDRIDSKSISLKYRLIRYFRKFLMKSRRR